MNKKKLIVIIILVLLIGIITFLLVKHFNKTDNINDLKTTYSNKEIEFNDFSSSFEEVYTIKVENTSDENRTYSLEWSDVSNTLKKQNIFTYEITCTGDRCATLSTSQVPIASATVYTQVLIESGKTQIYKIIFKYNGSEANSKFEGKLKVHSEAIDQKKIEEQEKAERKKMNS